jgi:hypothetical protein
MFHNSSVNMVVRYITYRLTAKSFSTVGKLFWTWSASLILRRHVDFRNLSPWPIHHHAFHVTLNDTTRKMNCKFQHIIATDRTKGPLPNEVELSLCLAKGSENPGYAATDKKNQGQLRPFEEERTEVDCMVKSLTKWQLIWPNFITGL